MRRAPIEKGGGAGGTVHGAVLSRGPQVAQVAQGPVAVQHVARVLLRRVRCVEQ